MADETLQKLGISVKDINGMIQTVQTNAACDSDCREEKRVEGLYNAWQGNVGIEDSIPEKVKSSHKEWYIAVNGEQAYNNYLAIQTETVASRRGLQQQQKQANSRQEKIELDRKIGNLQTTYDKLYDYQNKLIKENQILEINLDRISGNINRNNRNFLHLINLKELFEGKINAMRKYNREQFEISDNRLNDLESNIEKEVSDRIEETDDIMNDTQTTLTSK